MNLHYCCLVTQLCPIFLQPMDSSLPGSSVHWTSQAKILEWVAIPFSKRSSQPRDRTQVSHIAGRFFTTEPPGVLQWRTDTGTLSSSPQVCGFHSASLLVLSLCFFTCCHKHDVLYQVVRGWIPVHRVASKWLSISHLRHSENWIRSLNLTWLWFLG